MDRGPATAFCEACRPITLRHYGGGLAGPGDRYHHPGAISGGRRGESRVTCDVSNNGPGGCEVLRGRCCFRLVFVCIEKVLVGEFTRWLCSAIY